MKVKVKMITNLKVPGIKPVSLAEFNTIQGYQWGRIVQSWPSENMFVGQVIRKIFRTPTPGNIVSETVFADSLDAFTEREAQIELLPPKTEFTYTIVE